VALSATVGGTLSRTQRPCSLKKHYTFKFLSLAIRKVKSRLSAVAGAAPLSLFITLNGGVSMEALSRLFACTLFACGFALLSSPAQSQDGTIRQRLKDGWQQRHQQQAPVSEAGGADARLDRPGDYRFTFEHDGLRRMFRVHVPAGYDPARPAPLLFALHGGGGGMDYQADDSRYGLISLSEQKNLVVVFPNGYSRRSNGMLATWNAGDCCGAARDKAVDDVGFIRGIVDRLTRQMNIDRQRIYAAGMSNGAMMAYRLACEMPEVFAAIAAVAGTNNTRDCKPSRPVSVLHIHARNDDHMLFDGGAGPGSRNRAAVTDYSSVPDTVAKWALIDQCGAAPQRSLNKPGAYCDTHAPCQGGTRVRLCVTETGGHSWPGAQKTRGAPASQAVSANELMWDFFNGR
jgi:polyhydroxybutyrate depolymerase